MTDTKTGLLTKSLAWIFNLFVVVRQRINVGCGHDAEVSKSYAFVMTATVLCRAFLLICCELSFGILVYKAALFGDSKLKPGYKRTVILPSFITTPALIFTNSRSLSKTKIFLRSQLPGYSGLFAQSVKGRGSEGRSSRAW